MAGSKTYKIGTVFSRTTGLIKAGGKRWEDRPLWYDVYEAFPPKVEPTYMRPEPTEMIKPIFYSEDIIRAKFYKEFGSVGLFNLSETNTRPTICQLFIEEFSKLKQNSDLSEDSLWTETVTALENRGIRLINTPQETLNEASKSQTLVDLFSEAQQEPNEKLTKNISASELLDEFKEQS